MSSEHANSQVGIKLQHGIVAILDALGAANYNDNEIKQFLRSREVVLEALNQKAEEMAFKFNLSVNKIEIYTFNDTLLKNGKAIRLKAVNWPKFFYNNAKEKQREKIHELLGMHNVPFGTEQKFFSTIAFFDYVVKAKIV